MIFEIVWYIFSELIKSLDTAQEKCDVFYAGETKVKKLGEGGQSIVYKCEPQAVNDTISKVVVKLYKNPQDVSLNCKS